MVISGLDYFKSLPCTVTLEQLISVLSQIKLLITRARCQKHVSLVLFNPHWLPIDAALISRWLPTVATGLADSTYNQAPALLEIKHFAYIQQRRIIHAAYLFKHCYSVVSIENAFLHNKKCYMVCV